MKKKKTFKPIVYKDKTNTVEYILISELPTDQRGFFCKWLRGQTCPVIEGVDIDDVAYPHDYDRWKRHRAGYFVSFD